MSLLARPALPGYIGPLVGGRVAQRESTTLTS